MVESVLRIMQMNQLWYLTEELVIFIALLNHEERKAMAESLLLNPRPRHFKPNRLTSNFYQSNENYSMEIVSDGHHTDQGYLQQQGRQLFPCIIPPSDENPEFTDLHFLSSSNQIIQKKIMIFRGRMRQSPDQIKSVPQDLSQVLFSLQENQNSHPQI